MMGSGTREAQGERTTPVSHQVPLPAALKQTTDSLLHGDSSIKSVPDQQKSRRVMPEGAGKLSSDELTERVKGDLEQIAALARPQDKLKFKDHGLSKEQLNQLLSLETLLGKGRPSKILSSKSNRVTAIFPDFEIAGLTNKTKKDLGDHFSEIVEDHRDLFGVAKEGVVSASDADCIEDVCRIVIKKSFGGLPAWDHDLIFTTNKEKLYSIQGEFYTPDIGRYTNERLSEETLQSVVAEHFKREVEQLEFQSSELGITLDNGRDFLAYKIEVGLGKYKRFEVYVDVQSKRVPKVIPLVQHAQVSARGVDLAGNSVSFQAESRSGVYDMKDSRFPLNGSTHVYSAEDKTGYEENYTNDVYYISSSSPNSGWDPAGVSAVKNAKTLVDYFKSNHSFDAPSRGEQDITIGVNLAANNNGLKDNALALGNNLFIFGAGNGVTNNNWALGLDVMAHEITHGVINSTSRLVYRYESGALNESFADFFGAMTDSDDWLIGEDIYIQEGKFLRSMSNPQDQNADPPQPAHMSQFNSARGVHSNSGIFNRGLYLLAEGLTAEGLGSSVGRRKAADIAFKTMRSLSPNSSFDQAATAMIATAQSEYGASSNEVIATTLAMKSVGLPEDTYTTISTSGIISPTSTATVYLYPRYTPRNFGPEGAGSNEYSVYVQYFVNSATSYDSSTDFGPLPGQYASLKRPSLIFTDDGNFRYVYEGKSDGKLYSYSSATALTEEVKIGDYTISNLALSNDFSTLVFTVVESPTIFVLDLTSMDLTTHIVRGPSTSRAGSAGQTAAYVDSIRYDPTQRYVVFDYLSCGVTSSVCDSSNTSSFWTIGFMDVQSGNFSYPFPSQSSTLDVGYPAFSNTTDRYIVFDIINYAADTASGFDSGVYLYDVYDGGAPRYIGDTDDTSSALGYFGTPSFTSDDSGVVFTWRTDTGSTLWRAGIQNYSRDGTYSIINDYDVFQPMAIPGETTNRVPTLALSSNSLDFGDVVSGTVASAELCAENSGHFPIELGLFAAANDAITWSAQNQVILDGQQVCGSLSVDSSYYSKGSFSTVESLIHNGSNSPKAVTINAIFDSDTDSDGTLDYADDDDDGDTISDLDEVENGTESLLADTDGDGVNDNIDLFPIDPSETIDTDSDGIGNNADPDDDGDTLSDGDEVLIGTNPLVADSDGDGVNDNLDILPLNADETSDTDGDLIGNNTDADDDNDGILDTEDDFPLDARYSQDTDSDGMPNAYEDVNGLNKYLASDSASDTDGDGLTALQEFGYGTSPSKKDSDSDTLPDGWEVENGRDPSVADYQVSLGGVSCALDDTGVVCWGNNSYGQTDLPALSNPTQVSLGVNHTCALDDTGSVCWGYNGYGQTDVPALSNPTQVSLGFFHTCALDDTGAVCWGYNSSGQTDVPALSNPTQVSLGAYHTCVLDDTGVVCWGNNGYGQTDVPVVSNPTQVSLGRSHTCALDDTGVVCWGYNNSGQTDVPALSNPTQVSLGGSHTCVLDDTGVVCWGNNGYGQTDVPVVSNPTQVSLGRSHTCVLDDTGVVCWGRNDYGQTDVPALMIDPDGDGFSNQVSTDAFPFDRSASEDFDGDGLPDSWNAGKSQADSTSTPKLTLDLDDDNDGVADIDDLYPLNAAESADSDGDLVGDNADAFPNDASETVDTDLDGIGDNSDNCLNTSNSDQLNSDSDSNGNACDDDDDNDGLADVNDALPLNPNEQVDTDGDLIGNNEDQDDDNDNVPDTEDSYPLNSLYSADSDGDGMPDAWEIRFGLNPNDASDAGSDIDNDGAVALQEFIEGTIPHPTISGMAYHWRNHSMLESVQLSLVGIDNGIQTNFSDQTISDKDGSYAFSTAYAGTNRMTASKAINAGESGSVISSADALAALKIAVGINPNTDPDGAGPEEALPVSPYQYIAADITGDGRVTSADALAILKMAVKLDSAEPRRWVFVAEDYDFWDEGSGAFKTTRTDVIRDSEGMTFDYPEKSVQNVVGVLMGDVNGNWTAPEESETVAENYFSELVASQGGSIGQWGIKRTQGPVGNLNGKSVAAADMIGNPQFKAMSYGGYRSTIRTDGPSISDIKEDLSLLFQMGVRLIRTYNTQQYPFARNTLQAIRELKAANSSFEMYVMLGAWIECKDAWTSSPDHSVGNTVKNGAEIAAAVDLVNEYPDIVKIIAVGNESMVRWATSYFVPPSVVLFYVNYLQDLKERGEIPAETWITSSDNHASWGGSSEYRNADLRELIRAVDFVSLHTYPFHDSHHNPDFWGVPADEDNLSIKEKVDSAMVRARNYASDQYSVTAAYVRDIGGSEKRVAIGETGWSSLANSLYGNPGSNAADEYKEKMFFDLMTEWSSINNVTLFYFEAFDEPWKDTSNSRGSENHFGLFTVDGKAKYALWDFVDEGNFDGLGRDGGPVQKTFDGDESSVMATVYPPSSNNNDSQPTRDRISTVNTSRSTGEVVTESVYVISDSSLLPTELNSMTYPSSTLWINAWEGTSTLEMGADNIFTLKTGTGSWWGAGLEIESSSGEDLSQFIGGTLTFDIRGNTTSNFNIGFQSGLWGNSSRPQVNNFVRFGPKLSRSIDSYWVTHEIPMTEINKGADLTDVTSLIYLMGDSDFDGRNIEIRNIFYRQ